MSVWKRYVCMVIRMVDEWVYFFCSGKVGDLFSLGCWCCCCLLIRCGGIANEFQVDVGLETRCILFQT